jgi:hypothetical protein
MFVARSCSHVVRDQESVSDSCLAVFGHREAHDTDVVLFIVACELIWEDMYSSHNIFNHTTLTNTFWHVSMILVGFQMYVDNCGTVSIEVESAALFALPIVTIFAYQHHGRAM